MKKILKTFTFWFILLSIFIIVQHQIGYDSKSITLIGLNPILVKLPYDLMDTGPQIAANTIAGSISLYWYIACVLSFILYGLIFDFIKLQIAKKRKKRNK